MNDQPFFPFHRPTVTEKHIQAVVETLKSGWLTSAGKVQELEKAFAKKVGAKHAIAVNSCTAALHLALEWALREGAEPGIFFESEKEVITSPITFVSAVNVIEQACAKPVFADVRNSDLTIDPAEIRRLITRKTRAIIATHLAGFPCQMNEIEEIGKAYGIPVICDAAHAIETQFRGRPSGDLGDASCYSLYATKNITCGEGGILTTSNDELADFSRKMRQHGMDKDAWKRYGTEGYKHWDVDEPGWKYNLSDIQAALALAQLEDMDAWRNKREELVSTYEENIRRDQASPLAPPDPNIKSAYHLFVVRVKNRDRVMDELQKRGIGVGVHFRAVHRLKYYQDRYKIPTDWMPVAEQASQEVLSLPLYPSMTTEDVKKILKVFHEIA